MVGRRRATVEQVPDRRSADVAAIASETGRGERTVRRVLRKLDELMAYLVSEDGFLIMHGFKLCWYLDNEPYGHYIDAFKELEQNPPGTEGEVIQVELPHDPLGRQYHFFGNIEQQLADELGLQKKTAEQILDSYIQRCPNGIPSVAVVEWPSEKSIQKALLGIEFTEETSGNIYRFVRAEHTFSNRRRADLLLRSEDGNWLIIELKRGIGDEAAVDQLEEYVRLARAEIAGPDETVIGALACFSTVPEARQRLLESDDLALTSWAQICLPWQIQQA